MAQNDPRSTDTSDHAENGASSASADRTRQLIDLIAWHGCTEQAAQTVIPLAEALLAQMRREPDPDRQREHGGVVDTATGEQIGAITVGTRRSVSFDEQIRAAREHGTASVIGVHTHPGNSSFSPADAGLFEKDAIVAIMVVVGPDGSWYMISPEPDTTPPPVESVVTGVPGTRFACSGRKSRAQQ